MKTKAAVLRDVGKDWEITELDLDPPKDGEVLVRFVAAGLCHSDEHLRTGDIPVRYPIVGGHEGAGIVEEVGAGRHPAQAGRPRRLLVPARLRPLPVLRARHDEPVRPRRAARGQLPAGRHVPVPRRRPGLRPDVPARHVLPVAVVSEHSCVKIDDDLPLETVALVGCGVPTGWGTAVNAGGVRPGDTVVVYGIGGVGINAVQGAAFAGAQQHHRGRPAGVQAGEGDATSAPRTVAADADEAQQLVTELTRGVGADEAIVTVGLVPKASSRPRSPWSARAAWSSITGLAGPGEEHPDTQLRAHPVREADPGRAVRRRQPVRRHPADARAVPGRAAQAGRADHQPVPAGGRQPGLPGHDGRPEHPRPDPLRALTGGPWHGADPRSWPADPRSSQGLTARSWRAGPRPGSSSGSDETLVSL